ncbi:MAG: 23S rRNA (pseudouridine(1915)-N(3))-methyltransferase RlmH [Erysipelotrichaceae bacterium]|nr:23S rRNA (pseudouridine(1915)-N(3))-methyltransferase RlmH [Erysipelotrichaceae bacterium]MDY5251882.1 23S rRNA (pseudouridine(1915)-N(3))-methyltransferase RlmH [Erysipelotrichaceae bacterium]
MIKIIAVGKIKEKYLKDGINEYIKRLAPYTKMEIIELPDENTFEDKPALNQQVKQIEGQRILNKIGKDDFVIALDLHGDNFSSEKLAKKLAEIYTYHTSKITFVIAGSLGYDPQVIARANLRWKLSDCTFPHQLVRLLLVEQIYRCYKINNHEPYHK